MLQINPKNIVPVTEARANLNRLINQTKKEKISLLTKQGKPAVILMDPLYFSILQDKIERLTWSERFDSSLKKARRIFRKYLIKKGYDPEKVTEKQVQKIIAEI